MTDTRSRLDQRVRAQAERQRRWGDLAGAGAGADAVWSAGSVVLAGVLLGAGAGWLVGHLTGWGAWPVAVGLVAGLALAVVDLWFRYVVAADGPTTERDAGTPTARAPQAAPGAEPARSAPTADPTDDLTGGPTEPPRPPAPVEDAP